MTESEDQFIRELSGYCCNVPLNALRQSAKRKMSNYLDQGGILVGDYTNDWYGLAEIIGYTNLEIKRFEQSEKPTVMVLENWATRRELSPTVDTLFRYLLEIQRTDVILDTAKIIKRDIDCFKLQVTDSESNKEATEKFEEKATIKRYDAFVVFSEASKDAQFVKEMIKMLEEQNFIHLFIPGRDDLAGTERYVLTADMIANGCRRVVVVMSENFKHSEYCDFALKFSHSLSPGAKSKRIIPILLDDIEMPSVLKHVGKVNYYNTSQREWVWDRIAKTIKSPLIPNKEDWQCTVNDLKNMKYNTKSVAHMLYSLGVACMETFDDEEHKQSVIDKRKGKKTV